MCRWWSRSWSASDLIVTGVAVATGWLVARDGAVVGKARQLRALAISMKTIAALAKPFAGGDGPSQADIDVAFASADADDHLPAEGNKQNRVLTGLRTMRNGGRTDPGSPRLAPAPDKLVDVAQQLAMLLVARGWATSDEVHEALEGGPAASGPPTPRRLIPVPHASRPRSPFPLTVGTSSLCTDRMSRLVRQCSPGCAASGSSRGSGLSSSLTLGRAARTSARAASAADNLGRAWRARASERSGRAPLREARDSASPP